MNLPPAADALDLRPLAPPGRHRLLCSRFSALADGQALDLLADEDPAPMYFQLERRHPGGVAWHYVEAGPLRWQVRVERCGDGAPLPVEGGCGACRCGGR